MKNFGTLTQAYDLIKNVTKRDSLHGLITLHAYQVGGDPNQEAINEILPY